MMVFEETTRSLFPSDLFIQPGEQPALVREDLSVAMCEFYKAAGIFASEAPVRHVVDRLEALAPERIHAMHGGTLTGEVAPRYYRTLRERDFAFDGRVFGRMLPQGAPAIVG